MPNDAAFEKLPSEQLNKLLDPVWKPQVSVRNLKYEWHSLFTAFNSLVRVHHLRVQQLRDLILYHALRDEVYSTDLIDNLSIRTLNYQGDKITIDLGDPPKINGKSVILVDQGIVDIEARNGVIHAVDAGE